ncbi:MAG: hypothetical protein KA752_04630, partial [Giesbergeria sp.]|nr:hypothetical protein [Giesbergeria sp.]
MPPCHAGRLRIDQRQGAGAQRPYHRLRTHPFTRSPVHSFALHTGDTMDLATALETWGEPAVLTVGGAV